MGVAVDDGRLALVEAGDGLTGIAEDVQHLGLGEAHVQTFIHLLHHLTRCRDNQHTATSWQRHGNVKATLRQHHINIMAMSRQLVLNVMAKPRQEHFSTSTKGNYRVINWSRTVFNGESMVKEKETHYRHHKIIKGRGCTSTSF